MKQEFKWILILFPLQAFIDVSEVIYADPPILSFLLLLSTPSLLKK